MKEILVSIPEKEYPFFLKLVKSFDFVKINEPKKKSNQKKSFLDGLRQSVQEVNDIKRGKLKGIPAKTLLNEL